MDEELEELFEESGISIKKTRGGRGIIPDNFGFIFISSKPEVIKYNPDLISRLEFVDVTKESRESITTADELLDRKVDINEYRKNE